MDKNKTGKGKMREMGFTKNHINQATNRPKLDEDKFTTFRVERKDTDWKIRETVTIVMHPRSKKKQILGIAKIINKEPKFFFYMPNRLFEERIITEEEAKRDGFASVHDMYMMMRRMHGPEKAEGKFNKLTLRWIERVTIKKGVLTSSKINVIV